MKRRAFRKALVLFSLLCLCCGQALPSDAAALTAEELAYRDQAGVITIGCPVDNCPMLFKDEKTGQLKGIVIDILDMVASSTGLAFRYQALPSGPITYDDLQHLQVDLLACTEANEFNQHALGIALTDAYLHAAKVFVCKKDADFRPDGPMTIAVSSGSQTLEKVIREQYPQFQLLFCDSTEAALSALLAGKADAVLQNQYTIERILRKPVYAELRIVATASIGDSQCLALLVPIDEARQNVVSHEASLLLSILNQGIAELDQSQIAFRIIKLTSENAYRYTLGDLVYLYRYTILALTLSLLLILVLLCKNRALRKKRAEQLAAQQRAQELATINAQMEEQQLLLMDALKHAEEASRAKTSFLFNMSHDIRTPMNAILGFTEIARRNRDNPTRLADCLEKIQSSGKHLLQLINDVLDMAKIESGKLTLAEDCCDLRACIEKVRDILQAEADQKRLTLRIDTAAVENSLVRCDGLRFNQILFNLLSNAVKFTRPEGHILVTLSQQRCAMPEYAAYELRVKDDGIGMSPAFLEHIFEPFERERTATVSQTQGTGLGMSITKNLVALMGGDIQVASEPGRGTEFVLHFTFKLQARPPEARPTAGTAPAEAFAGKRLLLVDDNALNMEIAQELLIAAGFLVETAVNGQLAVEMVQRSAAGYYDAILMDIQMPVMNGYEAAQAIRGLEDKALAEIPIIALTANAFDEDKKEALAHGMNAHIAKPLDVAVLYDTLRGVLQGR